MHGTIYEAMSIMSSPLSILVVDDDVDLLFVVKLLLIRQGYITITLSDCTKFFALLRDKPPPDLIILDINLGPCDGRDLCLRVKQIPSLQHIPIVLYSSDRLDDGVCAASNATCFIQKPFTANNFCATLSKLLMR